MSDSKTYCGYVALVGRPNVGKSTLLNRLLMQKTSITSRKPQTTRHRVLGVQTRENYQSIFVDTPGLHGNATKAINRFMNKEARQALRDVELVTWIVEASGLTEADHWVFSHIQAVNRPTIVLINKVDHIKDKQKLLPLIAELQNLHAFVDIIPVSAKTGDGVTQYEACIQNHLPESPHFFEAHQTTDRSVRFQVAELIREKLMRLYGNELPYETTVEIETFEQKGGLWRLVATIWVARPGQKRIIVGTSGQALKRVGSEARQDIERLLGDRAYLNLWVKVKRGWSDDIRAMHSLGYQHETA